MRSVLFALITQVVAILLPWRLRRLLLQKVLGFNLASTSKIGFSILLVDRVVLRADARIGSLTVIKGLAVIDIGEGASIGNLNWVTGFPLGTGAAFFADQPGRNPSLYLGRHSAVTNRHLIDCTDSVSIGQFSTFAGFGSQILTHSIDIYTSRQRAAPVSIGEYCFIGTRCVLLPGASVPERCVLGAGSVLGKILTESHKLYGGVPAQPIKSLDPAALYFHRSIGRVD